MQRAQFVPFRRNAREIGLRGLRPLTTLGLQPRLVGIDMRIRAVERVKQRMQQTRRRGAIGEPEEGPRPLAMTLDQPRFDQQLEMARDARLRLAENVGQVRDG